MSFSEARLEIGIRYGVAGGPEFSTSIITVESGFEQRNANWLDARGAWDLADDVYSKSELNYMIDFFRTRRGKFEGFRFKDWSDFLVTTATSSMELTEVGLTYQLLKLYVNGGYTYARPINKPIASTVKIYKNAVLLVPITDYVLDPTTGWVEFVADPTGYTLTWEGEFDVPVRFDTDKFNASFDAYRESDMEALYNITSLPLVELRIDPMFSIPNSLGNRTILVPRGAVVISGMIPLVQVA